MSPRPGGAPPTKSSASTSGVKTPRRQGRVADEAHELKLPAVKGAEELEASSMDHIVAGVDWKSGRRRGNEAPPHKQQAVVPKKAAGDLLAKVPAAKLDIPTTVQLDLPNVVMICRTSYQVGLNAMSRQESALAIHRREQDIAAKRRTRMQAAAWRRSCERRERELQRRKRSLLMRQEACEALAELEGIAQQEEAGSQCSGRGSRRSSSLGVERRGSRHTLIPSGPASARGEAKKYSAVVRKTLASIKRSRPAAYPEAEELQEGEREAFQLHGTKRSRELARRLAALPEEERTALRDIFGLYDMDGSGLLEKEELRNALYELGLVCLDAHERRVLSQLCDKKSNGKVGCDFTEFAVDLVPAVRKALNTLRLGRLQKNIDGCHRNITGKFNAEEVFAAVERLLPLDLVEKDSEFQKPCLEEVRKHTADFVQDEDLQSFFASVMRVVEDKQRGVSLRQRRIQAEHGIEEEDFQNSRYQLIYLESIFNHVDIDGSGDLTVDEVMEVFKILGVAPKSQTEQRKIKAMMHKGAGADFRAFLDLVMQIRTMYVSQPNETLLTAFESASAVNHDGDKILEDKRITAEQLRGLLEELGVLAPSAAGSAARQRDTLAGVLQEEDPEGWENFGYEEVKRILQRVHESIRQQAVRHEAAQIQACRFNESELEDLRWAFDRLDDTGSGVLAKDEVAQAFDMLGVEFVREIHFNVAYRTLDADANGKLEFVEFLRMMKMVRDKEGPLKSDTSPVRTLSCLDASDLLLLLDSLNVRWEVSVDMTEKQMLERACDLLEIGPTVVLWPACGCSCLRDLFKYARQHIDSRPGG